jgi:hypothetical protein
MLSCKCCAESPEALCCTKVSLRRKAQGGVATAWPWTLAMCLFMGLAMGGHAVAPLQQVLVLGVARKEEVVGSTLGGAGSG